MSARVISGVALMAAMLLLAGCSPTAPGAAPPDTGPPISDAPSAPQTPTPTAATSAAPEETEPSPPGDQPAPPVAWSDQDLVGACKVAWIETGSVIDWSTYNIGPIANTGDSYTVQFVSTSGNDPLNCTISGSPENPSVTTG